MNKHINPNSDNWNLNPKNFQTDKFILKHQLLRFIHTYNNKPHLKMKPVFQGIIKRLFSKGTISFNQFKSVQKYLIRENQFIGFDIELLIQYFFPIIETPKEYSNNETHYPHDTRKGLELILG